MPLNYMIRLVKCTHTHTGILIHAHRELSPVPLESLLQREALCVILKGITINNVIIAA